MTPRSDSSLNDAQSPLPSIGRMVGWAVGGSFSAGALAGYRTIAAEHGPLGALDLAILAILAAISLACAAMLMRQVGNRVAEAQAVGPRGLAVRRVMVATALLGTIAGLILVLQGGNPSSPVAMILSDAAIPVSAAWALLAVIALTVGLTWLWHAKVDEHEAAANSFGALLAINVYFTLSAGWWIAWRGGMLVAPDGKAIFWAVFVIWGSGWLWKRYR